MTGPDDRHDGTSRRTFLKVAAATGAIAGLEGVGAGQQEQRIELVGAIGGWIGQAPEEIANEQNPTLDFQAGQRYVVEWTNSDGYRHNFVIIDADGNQVVRSDIVAEQGATQTVEFEATEDMVEYFCEIHPRTMRGDIEVAAREEIQPSQEEDIAPQGPEIGLQTVAEGLTAPLDFETAPGAEDRQFVVDQTGQIYVIGQDGLQEEPFLDVSDRMVELGIEELNGYDERGLLGLAFHPNFQQNRRFFVRYSAPFRGGLGAEGAQAGTQTTGTAGTPTDGATETGAGTETEPGTETEAATDATAATEPTTTTGDEGTVAEPEEATAGQTPAGETPTPEGKSGGPPEQYDHTDVLSEFQASDDLTSADPNSERIIMEIASPQDNHNGGAISFGPDGYLYTSIGDGGAADDVGFGHVQDWYDENEGGNGQDLEANPLGSILRIDVDAQRDGQAYAIPDDNPLVDETDYPEQWAWGFRNPWRMSFNDGQLFVGDAGQNLWEEVDIVESGGNYGWNVKEATHCFSTADPTESLAQCPNTAPNQAPYEGQELLDPIIEYPHRQATVAFIDGSVVIGGYTYEGDAIPELQGTYLFGNWSAQGVVNPEGEIFAASPPDGGTGTNGGTETTAGEGTETETDGRTDGTTVEGQAPAATAGPQGQYGGTWSFEELVISGAQDGRLDRYVYAFGRDQDGELYVCTNRQFRPEGNTGAVHRIVPPDQGDLTTAPQQGTETEDTATEETPTNETQATTTGTPANETAATETGTPDDGN